MQTNTDTENNPADPQLASEIKISIYYLLSIYLQFIYRNTVKHYLLPIAIQSVLLEISCNSSYNFTVTDICFIFNKLTHAV